MENICSFVSIVGGQCGHDRETGTEILDASLYLVGIIIII